MALNDPRNPSEEVVLRTIAQWLDLHGVLWCHVPNEGRHKPQYRAKMAALGLKPGVPDILIFDLPPEEPEARGVAIELKRAKGGRVSKVQQEWLEELGGRGWVCSVCEGIDEALDLLRELGYGRRRAG